MSATADSQRQWFGHPRGLATLFFTEFWERFSYYGMRAILVLYMAAEVKRGGMGLSDGTATAVYGLYTATVYLACLPGGWLADRIFGQRGAVLYGGLIIALGHFSMALLHPFFFFLGLVLIVLGTGLLKPNVSAIVGELYPEGGARRDAGFSIFYMGINFGALVGPAICGVLGESVDWHWGFGAAGIGMIFGIAQYWYGGKYLGDAGLYKPKKDAKAEKAAAWKQFGLGIAVVVGLCAIPALLHLSGAVSMTLQTLVGGLGWVLGGIAIVYFLYIFFGAGLDREEKKRVIVIFILFIGAALFWAGFEQAGSSMNLYAERLTNRYVPAWFFLPDTLDLLENFRLGAHLSYDELVRVEVPASILQSINPLFIVLLAPVFGSMWVWLAARGKEPSIPTKFGLGLIFLGLGFAIMMWAVTAVGDSPTWLISTYFLHTVGELCLSPVGLSSVTKLSPKRLVGQMMGVWFLGASLGSLIAGIFAGFLSAAPTPGMFGFLVASGIGFGLLFIILAGPIKKLMGGVK